MANPFDEFDEHQANPFDEFDDEGMFTKALGLGEGALSTASSLAAAIPTGIRTLGELAATGGNLKEALERAESTTEAATYNPKTETGKKTAKEINELLQKYADEVQSKYSSDTAELTKRKLESGQPITASDLAAENTEQTVGGLLGNLYVPGIPVPGLRGVPKTIEAKKVLDKQAELEAAAKPPTANPFDQFDNMDHPTKEQYIDSMVAPLHDQDILANLQEIDRQQNLRENYDNIRQEDAQQALDDRQTQLEQEVAQKAGLDYNAAERARQENADIPAQRDPVLDDPSVPQEQKDDYQLLMDEANRNKQNTSGTPAFYKDPDANLPNPPMRVPRGQRGAVNPEVFQEGFQKLKQLADGTWLRAYGTGRGLTIEAVKDSHTLGTVDFSPEYVNRAVSDERNLQASFTASDQKGLATQMYQFAGELGNDIQRSPVQTKAGQKMWQGFEDKGIAQNGVIKSPGNKQTGALMFGTKQIEKVLGKSDMIPDNPDVPSALEKSYGEKDSKNWNLMESGKDLAAIKRGSTIVRTGGDLTELAGKRADLRIRQNVEPVERIFRSLSKDELQSVTDLLKHESFNGKRLDPRAIEELPVKLQKAYAYMRNMLDDTLKIQNEARKSQGLDPISPKEAYLSHMWDGDYRRPIYQSTEAGGRKLVWYLAADSKKALEAQTAALLKEHPDLIVDKSLDHTVRFYKRQSDLQSALTTMMSVLGHDDPAVQRMLDVYGDLVDKQTGQFLGQQKHFEPQTGVRGYVGDRPNTDGFVRRAYGSVTGKNFDFREATAFMQHQIQYAKNAYRWSELQRVGPQIKQILTDKTLRAEQPNNLAYVREHWKNALGQNEARWVSALNDALRDGLGIDANKIQNVTNDVKGFFVVQKLMVSAGYSIMNAVQSGMIIPHLINQFVKGNRGNLITAIPTGVMMGIAAMGKHYGNYWFGEKGIPQDMRSFYGRAMKYAEDNGITTNSIYQGDPIRNAFSIPRRAADALGRTISAPEGLSRSIAFFTAVEYLRSTEKYTSDIPLFKDAEHLTNAAIADHRTGERPMVFRKGGFVGNMFSTLQTWPTNFLNQWKYFGTEAMKGNVAPFVAAMAFQYAVAGVMGVPFMRDVDKGYQFFKDHMLPTKWWMDAQNSDFWRDPKVWMMNHMGSASVYGMLSDKTGIGLTTRLAAPGGSEMMQNPIGPFADLGKQAYLAGKAVYDPEKGFFNRDNVAQSAMASSPPGLQGVVENLPAFEGSTFDYRVNNQTGQKERLAMMPGSIDKHQAVYARTPDEDTLRYFGLRSQKEAETRELGYRLNSNNQAAMEKVRNLPDAFYAAAKTGDIDAAREYYRAYALLMNKGISNEQLKQQLEQNYLTTTERAALGAKQSVTAMQNVARAQAILQQIQKEQGQ